MGIFDRFRGHGRDRAKETSDMAEKKVNEKTGDKYTDQVDDAQQRIEGAAGLKRDRPDQP
ncbi:Rv0909 family putative TA system antitoxin [Streptomyces sp. 142MFCol3.1]|uniref:Rv0909 family putative TA system antitoxin n=1 Tax=Streptomyces sp. 142MFCol3.1 TaxID=1172179 RepID=UPI0004163625|nr:Rv0909 family putative TA system antitoxin [Streptomyces sp. 142MFCol3.1]